jgi:hypothetical protein
LFQIALGLTLRHGAKRSRKGFFFAENDSVKAALVEAGAEEWSIYTRAELQILVGKNRVRPFIPDELLRLHQAKRTFNSRITK